jgi:hypothetical protein
MIEILKNNLELAIKWKDQSVIALVKKSIQNELKNGNLSEEEKQELYALLNQNQ